MPSLREFLLIAAIIAAVYFFGRLMKRRSDIMVRKKHPKPPSAVSMELAKCRVCGVFVGPDAAACERADCPQGG